MEMLGTSQLHFPRHKVPKYQISAGTAADFEKHSPLYHEDFGSEKTTWQRWSETYDVTIVIDKVPDHASNGEDQHRQRRRLHVDALPQAQGGLLRHHR
jgi:hypothetical protein